MTKRKPDKEVVCLGSAVDNADAADEEADEGVSLVMMRPVLMLIIDADEMLVSDVMTVDDQEEARQGGRVSGFSCG